MSEIKKSGEVYEYTKEEIEELIKCKDDFDYFTKYVYIMTENDGEQPLKLRPYQKEIIDLIKDNRFSIIMSSRQSGKCVEENTLVKILDKKTGKSFDIKIRWIIWKIIGKQIKNKKSLFSIYQFSKKY